MTKSLLSWKWLKNARCQPEQSAMTAPPAPQAAGMKSSYYHQQPYHDPNTESYAGIAENGYKDPLKAPYSTFSIDVDNASYSNVRRFINLGQKVPADAVRIEEMINYFKYDYPKATGEHPFSVYTEAGICPWNKNHYLLHIGLRGKDIDKSELPSVKPRLPDRCLRINEPAQQAAAAEIGIRTPGQ